MPPPTHTHTHNWIQEKEEIIERMMLGPAQSLSISLLDEARVKDTAIKWIGGRREEADDERWGWSVTGRRKAKGVVVEGKDRKTGRSLTKKNFINHKSNTEIYVARVCMCVCAPQPQALYCNCNFLIRHLFKSHNFRSRRLITCMSTPVLLMVKLISTPQSVRASVKIHHIEEAVDFSLHADNKSEVERAL